MSRKGLLSILLVLVLMLVVVGCGADETPPSDVEDTANGEEASGEEKTPSGGEQYISIATGGTAGVYYPLGGAMAKIYNDNLEGITANAQSTGASVENIGLVAKGETEIAFIQNDITYYAYTGTEVFEDKGKVENIRGMAMLYPELVQIIATKDSGIETVADIKGKRVAIGAPGSGTEANARQILGAYGITYDDLAKADYLSFDEATDQLKDKHVDAAFVTAGIPTSAVTELAQVSEMVLVEMPSDELHALIEDYPFYIEVVVPAGTYKGQDQDVNTAAVMAMLVVPEELDDDLVYDLTKTMFEQRQVIIDTHERGNDIKLETALDGMPIEIHPGALRYYEEEGITN